MSENTPVKRDELGRIVKGSASLNPLGARTKDESIRYAEELLSELSPQAVKKLGELLETADPKTQATVALGVVKVTIGELQRVAAKDGGNPLGIDLSKWTPEQLLALWKK